VKRNRILIDSDPIVAILSEKDQHHQRCVAELTTRWEALANKGRKRSAMARPTPLAAPVVTATLSLHYLMDRPRLLSY
jgi:hypothetical protein